VSNSRLGKFQTFPVGLGHAGCGIMMGHLRLMAS
jgi:hypothetical protein